MGNGPMLGNASTLAQPGYHVDGPPSDPAVQTVVIEALRQQYQSAGDSAANILPVTALTPVQIPGTKPLVNHKVYDEFQKQAALLPISMEDSIRPNEHLIAVRFG